MSLSFNDKVGEEIKEFKVCPDRVVQIITTGKTVEESPELMFEIMNSINVEIIQ